MAAKVIIIGGVAAGASAAARLRRLDEEAQIILVERGEYISYANCGLPYYVGDVIRSKETLLVTTKEQLENRFKIDVRTRSEAVRIDREGKTVLIRKQVQGKAPAGGQSKLSKAQAGSQEEQGYEEYEESYDKLVIATGSSPLRPRIAGIDDPRIRTIWTVPDVEKLKHEIQQGRIRSAAVVGGGFIGLEMAENLKEAGVEVSLIEAADQVMAPLDFEMAQMLHTHIRSKGVELHLSDGVDHFESEDNEVSVLLKSGVKVSAQMVILSIGVRPNSSIAGEAGLELTQRGGIVTDDHMRTSDPDIYAAGDVAEVRDFMTGARTMIALAGPANKQGRIAADNIAGLDDVYQGTQGSSVAKIFDYSAASTGMNEKMLRKLGIEYKAAITVQKSHAGYYPGALPMVLKLLFAPDGKKLFGAQIVGGDGVDKRIDTLGTAIRFNAGVEDLTDLELAYAPPFSSAKDPVNMIGFVAQNMLNGLISFSEWDVDRSARETILLDVREDAERLVFEIPGAVAVPLGQLRERLGELDREKETVVFCAIGVRAYNGARILMQNGFKNVKVYPGGTMFYMQTHSKETCGTGKNEPAQTSFGQTACRQAESEAGAKSEERILQIDCCGMQCPGPIMRVHQAMEKLHDGARLRVEASDPGFAKDITAWCAHTGNTLVSNTREGTNYVALVRKGIQVPCSDKLSCANKAQTADGSQTAGTDVQTPGTDVQTPATPGKNGMTLIVFDSDMDKVMAGFILANGAAAMGISVTMFFTFWGLAALRKKADVKADKTAVEKMFGAMLPKGASNLGISKWNMGGMGAAMMKNVMKDKNVASLGELMHSAMKAGVKMIACSMSMDVMGIREEELVDGVEVAGVGTYLGAAQDSGINLFI